MSARCSHSGIVSTIDFLGVGEALLVGELFPVVEHVRAKTDRVRETAEVVTDMACADHIQARRRFERLDVDLHLSAAHQAILLGEVVVQVVLDQLRLPRLDRVLGLPERVVLVAAAANGADGAAIRKHDHLCADALGRRSLGRDDRHERGVFAALERLGQRLENFLGHVGMIIDVRPV